MFSVCYNDNRKVKNMVDKKNEILQTVVEVEIQPYVPETEVGLEQYSKYSLDDFKKLGTAFLPLLKNFSDTLKGQSGWYKVDVPLGMKLSEFKNGGFFGTAKIIGDTKFAKQLELKPRVDPNMLYMAAVLLTVEKKLETIEETQQEILAFLEVKERTRIEGNLEILADIFNNYKYNIENQAYKTNKHLQVQEIKRDAEQSIKLYCSQITDAIKKQKFLHGDKNVEAKMKEVEKLYRNYQLALYVYVFAYFVEIILFENFEKAYLDNVLKTIKVHCDDYEALYTKTYETIEGYSQTSLETKAVKILSGISKGTGKTVAKIPLLNKTQLDENLISAGDRLGKESEDRTVRAMGLLFEGKTEFVVPFIENIQTINRVYNESLMILANGDYLYIKN